MSLFSSDYTSARERFRLAAEWAGFELASYPIGRDAPDGRPLTLDVARLGARSPRAVLVVSSGTHGVEGFFGSAVQLSLLQATFRNRPLPEHLAVVFVHAMNPYGFAHLRRVNEDNVDLNRNFLLPGREFAGAPEAYAALDPLLNPSAPPTRLEPFLPVAGAQIARHGFATLKNAVAQGQYAFPSGLFFGGKGPVASQRILAEHLEDWLGAPERVLHIDFHTGLGKWATYTLGIDLPADGARVAQLSREFGAGCVQGFEPKGVLYEIQGGLGRWLESRMPSSQYDCLLAEFGTYSTLRVLQALRAENAAHLHAVDDVQLNRRAKCEMLEVFCPRSPVWRAQVLEGGTRIVDQAYQALAAHPLA